MSSVNPLQFERPIQDAIRWCAQLPLASQEWGSPTVSRLRALLEQGNQLWEEATQVAMGGWRKRSIQETEQWKVAQRLWAEILESSRPMISEMRSSLIQARTPIDELKSEADWSNAVLEVVAKRSESLKREWIAKNSEYAKSGRVLLYFPFENLADGAAQLNSGGFYDVDNVPPWDLWVGFADETLISWVPPVLTVAAQMGIDANPEGCIRWADGS
jgi:hypothetical protein